MKKINYLYGEIRKSEAAHIMNILGIDEKSTVIDIGCGNARFLCALMKESGCKGIGVEPTYEYYVKAQARRKLKGLGDRLELKNTHYPCKLDSKYTHAIIHGCAWEKSNIMPVYRAIPKGVKVFHNSFAFNRENRNMDQTEFMVKTSYLRDLGTRFWYHKK